MNVLGVDWGNKTLGLASSRSGIIARELPEISADLDELVKLVFDEKIDQIVVGLPTAADGKEGPQAQRVRAFGDRLEVATGVPVEYEDEAFTSEEAQNHGGSHSTAARLILEQFLNRKSQN